MTWLILNIKRLCARYPVAANTPPLPPAAHTLAPTAPSSEAQCLAPDPPHSHRSCSFMTEGNNTEAGNSTERGSGSGHPVYTGSVL